VKICGRSFGLQETVDHEARSEVAPGSDFLLYRLVVVFIRKIVQVHLAQVEGDSLAVVLQVHPELGHQPLQLDAVKLALTEVIEDGFGLRNSVVAINFVIKDRVAQRVVRLQVNLERILVC